MGRRSGARSVTFEAGGGVTLRGDAWGSPASPPVLLLHGGGQTRHSWSGTSRALADEGWYAVALDLRGHGESDWAPRGEYGVEAFVEDARAVAEALGRRPAIVGASLGGITGLLAEAESPKAVAAAIVLVDVTPRLEPGGVERIIDFMTACPEGFATLEEAADAIAAYRRHRSRPKDLSGLAKNLRRGDDGRYRWHWDPAFLGAREGAAAERSGESSVNDPERLMAAARRLRVPTLLVRGRESDVVSERGAHEFGRAVPHARLADVSGAGHMVAGDRNDAFTSAVVDFLRSEVPR